MKPGLVGVSALVPATGGLPQPWGAPWVWEGAVVVGGAFAPWAWGGASSRRLAAVGGSSAELQLGGCDSLAERFCFFFFFFFLVQTLTSLIPK
jgi:hypothetical protein